LGGGPRLQTAFSGNASIEPVVENQDSGIQDPAGRMRPRAGAFVALLIMVSLVALVASLRQNSRENDHHERAVAEEQAVGVTIVVATRVADGLGDVGRFLEQAAVIAGAAPQGMAAPELTRFGALLGRLPLDRAMIQGVAVLDGTGALVAGAGSVAWTQAAAAGPVLLAAATGTPGRVAMTRLAGEPDGRTPATVVLSRAVTGADGSVVGVIAAALDPGMMRGVLDGLPDAAGRHVLVFDEAGAVLFQDGTRSDGRIAEREAARLLAAAPRSGRPAVTWAALGDADQSLDVLFHLADHPVLVAVDWPTDTIEAHRRTRALYDGLAGVGVGLALVCLALLYIREQQRSRRALQERVRERTEELALVNERLIDAERIGHLGHWERNLKTGEGYWSAENFRIYGLPQRPKAPELREFLTCIHADDREAARRMRMEVDAGRDTYELRCRVVRPDGTIRHVHSQAEVVRDAAGRSVRLIGTTLDITDLVEAELRLRESEEKYRTMFEVAREAIYLVDKDSHAILEANRAARRIYGYSGEEFRRLTTTDLSAEPEQTREAMRAGVSFVPLRRHRRKNGSEIYVELNSARAHLGNRTVLVMAVRDVTERVAAETRLATAKARLMEAERIAHLGHWEWLPVQDSHFWSEELYRIFGVSRAQVQPSWQTLLDRLHPDDRAMVATLPETLAGAGAAVARELRVIRPDGEERRIYGTLQVTRDGTGAITCVFGTALDVSDRYAAQQALLESHASLSAVINATEHDMVLLVSPYGTVQVANGKVAEIYGRPVSEIVGRRLDSFMPAEAARRRQALFDQVLATGASVHLEESIHLDESIHLEETVHPEESGPLEEGAAELVFDTHCAPAPGPDGRPIGVAVFARNITGRKLVENNLRKLSRAIEQTPLSVVVTDLDGVIEYVNPHFTTATGYQAGEVVGQNSRILKSDYTSPSDYQAMWSAIAAGEVWHGEFHNRRRDGQLFWERASIAPVHNELGLVTHYVAVKEDITERKRVEVELLAAKERAEAANIAKSQFLATISHELRTPLNAIIGFSECMRAAAFGPIGDERYQRYAGNIFEAGSHLLKLINDILDLANAEAGTFELAETIVDPRPEVTEAVAAMAEAAELRGLTIEVDLPDDLPLLYADQRAVRGIVTNLLSNAIKFTRRNGRIAVSAGLDENGLFTLRVADTGIGIPADQLDRVVQPFSQIDGNFTREHEGTGMGLALCRSMAELHGGHLELESAPGVGTTVTVRFPRARVFRPGVDPMPTIAGLF
jgi:PAS domain S-box-containing protein